MLKGYKNKQSKVLEFIKDDFKDNFPPYLLIIGGVLILLLS
jgi:hypothetical protein